MIAFQSNTNVTIFMWSSFFSNSCVIIVRTKFSKNTSDYLSYISGHTYHGYFSLNCLVEKEMGDTTLSDERRRILRRVKRHLVRDMDAEEVLLQMTAENVFNTTEEERIKVKLTRSEKNEQLLDILPSKGEKAYEIFKETLQEVHPHLANIILELGNCFDDHENQLALKKAVRLHAIVIFSKFRTSLRSFLSFQKKRNWEVKSKLKGQDSHLTQVSS